MTEQMWGWGGTLVVLLWCGRSKIFFDKRRIRGHRGNYTRTILRIIIIIIMRYTYLMYL